MRRTGAAGIGEHEDGGGEGEGERGQAEEEDQGIEATELLSRDGGVEVSMVSVSRRFPVAEVMRRAHGGGGDQRSG